MLINAINRLLRRSNEGAARPVPATTVWVLVAWEGDEWVIRNKLHNPNQLPEARWLLRVEGVDNFNMRSFKTEDDPEKIAAEIAVLNAVYHRRV